MCNLVTKLNSLYIRKYISPLPFICPLIGIWQTNNGQYTVLFWEPIDTSELELRIDDYVPIFACVGIKLYGCVSSEGMHTYYNTCGLHVVTAY